MSFPSSPSASPRPSRAFASIVRARVAPALVAAAAALAQIAAHAQAISHWKIVEGQGLSSGWVVLGMSFADVQARAPLASYFGCFDTLDGPTCEVDPARGPRVFAILDGFAPDSVVVKIQVNDNGSPIHWPTTAGARSGASLARVQSLYPGSVRRTSRYRDDFFSNDTWTVLAREQGYAYQKELFCNLDEGSPCGTSWYHEVFPVGGKPARPVKR